MIKYLTLENLIDINKKIVLKHGGLFNLRYRHLLENAVINEKNHFDGDIFLIAVNYMFALAKHKPFLDANTRTGFLAMDLFLKMNGIIKKFPTELTENVNGIEVSKTSFMIYKLTQDGFDMKDLSIWTRALPNF